MSFITEKSLSCISFPEELLNKWGWHSCLECECQRLLPPSERNHDVRKCKRKSSSNASCKPFKLRVIQGTTGTTDEEVMVEGLGPAIEEARAAGISEQPEKENRPPRDQAAIMRKATLAKKAKMKSIEEENNRLRLRNTKLEREISVARDTISELEGTIAAVQNDKSLLENRLIDIEKKYQLEILKPKKSSKITAASLAGSEFE
jgi:hypothetical protein